ncbi:MAG TPA: hypothetical protein VJ859_15645 [Allosphingosinicella sp.]|nr:hypothetical protein [Allosphingosinicella sp.]
MTELPPETLLAAAARAVLVSLTRLPADQTLPADAQAALRLLEDALMRHREKQTG